MLLMASFAPSHTSSTPNAARDTRSSTQGSPATVSSDNGAAPVPNSSARFAVVSIRSASRWNLSCGCCLEKRLSCSSISSRMWWILVTLMATNCSCAPGTDRTAGSTALLSGVDEWWSRSLSTSMVTACRKRDKTPRTVWKASTVDIARSRSSLVMIEVTVAADADEADEAAIDFFPFLLGAIRSHEHLCGHGGRLPVGPHVVDLREPQDVPLAHGHGPLVCRHVSHLDAQHQLLGRLSHHLPQVSVGMLHAPNVQSAPDAVVPRPPLVHAGRQRR
mmetsp:Transcript_11504/g.33394  ORF Transcript_11504/g.33394 Transcript_11504/m.33394 type:complete len:276 (+) Transcript_11504:1446-2273(+)